MNWIMDRTQSCTSWARPCSSTSTAPKMTMTWPNRDKARLVWFTKVKRRKMESPVPRKRKTMPAAIKPSSLWGTSPTRNRNPKKKAIDTQAPRPDRMDRNIDAPAVGSSGSISFMIARGSSSSRIPSRRSDSSASNSVGASVFTSVLPHGLPHKVQPKNACRGQAEHGDGYHEGGKLLGMAAPVKEPHRKSQHEYPGGQGQ